MIVLPVLAFAKMVFGLLRISCVIVPFSMNLEIPVAYYPQKVQS
jgi:hypothetical protein